MTDKARELLERALEWIEAQQEPRMLGANDISKEIRAYLAEPRSFVRLSEEEISELWQWSKTVEAEKTAPTQIHAFARAIEDALKEKNKCGTC